MWIIVLLLIALIPANIAAKKGRNFWLWYFYGVCLWIVALIHSVALSDNSGNLNNNLNNSYVPVIKEKPVYNTVKEVKCTSVDINTKVRVQSWNIEKDSNENVFLRISVFNTTQEVINALNIRIKGFDSFNNPKNINNEEFLSVLIQDLRLEPKSIQVIDNRIVLPDPQIRKVDIYIQQVCYENGNVENFSEPCYVKTCQESMRSQYLPYAKRITEQAGYYMIEKTEYWQCLCGEVNTENICLNCGISKTEARRFSKENAQFTYEQYIREDEKKIREQRQAKLEKEEKRRKYIEGIQHSIKGAIDSIKNRCVRTIKAIFTNKIIIGLVLIIAIVAVSWKVLKMLPEKEQGNFVGLDNKISLDMKAEEIKNIKLSGTQCVLDGENYRYNSIKLFDEYNGEFEISLNSNDSEKIDSMCFNFTSAVEPAELISKISQSIGEPVHKENYNDKRYEYAYNMWYLDDEKELLYAYNTRTKESKLSCEYLDSDMIQKKKQCNEEIKNNDELKQLNDEIIERVNYIGLSVEDVIAEKDAAFESSNSSSVRFAEKESTMLGYKGKYIYLLSNPNSDSFNDEFIGQITSVIFQFNDALNETDMNKVVSTFTLLYGENEESDNLNVAEWNSGYAQCQIYMTNKDSRIQFFQNREAYKYDPLAGYNDSTEIFEQLKDCDESILR